MTKPNSIFIGKKNNAPPPQSILGRTGGKCRWWGRNLAGISRYERIRVSSTSQSYTLTHLRPREVVVRFCLDL